MPKLTVKQLEALTVDQLGQKVRDDGGLVGVVRKAGDGVAVKFDWRYRFAGKVRTTTCGSWPKSSLAEIRAERDRLRRILTEEKKDPAGEKSILRMEKQVEQETAKLEQKARLAQVAELQTRPTVQDVFDRWMNVDIAQHKDGGLYVKRLFERELLPSLGAMFADDVRKAHLMRVVDPLIARGVNRTAKVAFSLLRQMFQFAVDRGLVQNNPSAAIAKKNIGKQDTERDRILSQAEITLLAERVASANLSRTTEAAIWITLSTGCRIGELASARWDHIDLEARTWRIPEENSKNGRAHTIHLSDFAVQQLEGLRGLHDKTDHVLPSRVEGRAASPKAITKQIGDRQLSGKTPLAGRAGGSLTESLVLPGGKWTPHDLRRSAASLMTELGVLPEVAEKCLNHTETNKIKRVYQRYSYAAEMADAWRRLGERLELLTRGGSDNVIVLERSA